ncbi:MAG: alkaline phosphatase, partial [Victivallaceae bacterium]
ENFGLKFAGDAKDPMVLNPDELRRVETAFRRSMGEADYAPGEDRKLLYGGYDPLSVTLTHILNNKAGVAWTTYSHTALPVATSAGGKNAAEFGGMIDNTDIANRLKPMLAPLP